MSVGLFLLEPLSLVAGCLPSVSSHGFPSIYVYVLISFYKIPVRLA